MQPIETPSVSAVDLATLEAEIETPDSVSLNSILAEKQEMVMEVTKLEACPRTPHSDSESDPTVSKSQAAATGKEPSKFGRVLGLASTIRKRLTVRCVLCALLWYGTPIFDYVSSIYYCADMIGVDGMRDFAIANAAIVVACAVCGGIPEYVEYKTRIVKKSTAIVPPPRPSSAWRLGYLADVPRTFLVLHTVASAPNCVYARAMCCFGSSASLMLAATMLATLRRSVLMDIIKERGNRNNKPRSDTDRRKPSKAEVLPTIWALLCISILHFGPPKHSSSSRWRTEPLRPLAEWNYYCSASPVFIRINTTFVYPIIDHENATVPSSYRLESAIEFELKVPEFLECEKRLTFTTDCSRLPAFDNLVAATNNDKCTVVVSMLKSSGDDRIADFDIEIKVRRLDGFEKSTQLCQVWNGRAGVRMAESYISSQHFEKVIRAYCGFESHISVRECPTATTTMKTIATASDGERPVAYIDCSQSCYGRSALNGSGAIVFDGVGGHMSMGGRMYKLKYRKHDSCDRNWSYSL